MNTITERLILHPLTPNEARRIIQGAPSVGDVWHAEYPPEDELDPLRTLAESNDVDPIFGLYMIRAMDAGEAIGGIGFFGPPKGDAVVELGFGLVESARGQGLATEALTAMVGIAFANGARRILADTLVENSASQRVLEKAGFQQVDRSEELLFYMCDVTDGLDVAWHLQWDADLSRENHAGIAALLARIYPEYQSTFVGERSWSGARPEGRVIGYINGRPVAHLGFLRRTLRVDGNAADQLVGDVGLVGIDPEYQRSGLGLRLLNETSRVFRQLNLPFGFLTCRPAVVPFYERGGWQQLPGQITRMIDNRLEPEVYAGPALVLAVLKSISEWPTGRTVIRDGLEV
jgi:nodulation protein A